MSLASWKWRMKFNSYDIAKFTNEREIQRNRNYIYLHTINFISLFFINELVFKSYQCVCIEHCLQVANELNVNIHFLQQHRLIFFMERKKWWKFRPMTNKTGQRQQHNTIYSLVLVPLMGSGKKVMCTMCTPKCRVDGCTMYIFTYSSGFERRKRKLCFYFGKLSAINTFLCIIIDFRVLLIISCVKFKTQWKRKKTRSLGCHSPVLWSSRDDDMLLNNQLWLMLFINDWATIMFWLQFIESFNCRSNLYSFAGRKDDVESPSKITFRLRNIRFRSF